METQIIHKAVFFWNAQTNKQQVTVCGNFDISGHRQIKVTDWDTVNCKRCLLNRDDSMMSSVNL